MEFTNTDTSLARELDARDELACFRGEFVIDDPNLIYLDASCSKTLAFDETEPDGSFESYELQS